jgi:hypothetical protein
MRKFLLIFLLIFGKVAFSQEKQALLQTQPFNVNDSLALVDFYYSINGPACPILNNWLVTPVRYWTGVHATYPDSTRVGSIILGNRPELNGTLPLSIGDLTEIRLIEIFYTNLTGAIPFTIGRLKELKNLALYCNSFSGQITDSIGHCEKLEGLNIQNNHFTGYVPLSLTTLQYFSGLQITNNQFDQLPDFSQSTQTQANNMIILAKNNLFTFEDIEPNIGNMLWFDYIPQFDSINSAIDTTVILDSSISLKTTIGGQNNIYTWYKDGVLLPWATDSILTINNVVYADSGVYTCNVTNSVVSGLEYHRRPIKLGIKSGVAVNGATVLPVFNIYPSITSDYIYIKINDKIINNLTCEIYNNIGIKVFTSSHLSVDSILTINIIELSSGVYILKVFYDNKSFNFKIIKI